MRPECGWKARYGSRRLANSGAQPDTETFECGRCGGWHIRSTRNDPAKEATR